ncbi:hypothetical protein V1264_016465 [Littorina saxatilis]|uniref:type I protein arginine methyltransferase n=1 Tax=Littorina saxatilis TaxID=31220 RepID=A0AAN9GI82_9CAEN
MASGEMDVPDLVDADMEEEEDVVVTGMGWDEDDDDDIGDGNDDLLLGPVKCLFCDRILNSAKEVFAHCGSDHSFNIPSFCGRWSVDCVGYIKMINFIRTQHPTADSLRSLQPSNDPAPWEDDRFMMPADPEDLLLQYDIESEDCSVGEVPEMAGFPAATPSTAGAAAVMSPEAAGLKPEELQAYMVQRLYEAESRATALEANLDRAVSDLNQMRCGTLAYFSYTINQSI